MSDTHAIAVRPYDPANDSDVLWQLKSQFELTLGSETGGPGKAAVYAAKLDDTYQTRYLNWVEWCTASEDCVLLATVDEEAVAYGFLLPEQLAMIWDAAVLNELYVEPAYRGSGVADTLMARLVDHAEGQSLPLDRLILDVDPANDRAQAFYDRHGFAPWGTLIVRSLAHD